MVAQKEHELEEARAAAKLASGQLVVANNDLAREAKDLATVTEVLNNQGEISVELGEVLAGRA